MDLRSPASACGEGEGGAPVDAAGHCRGEAEERQDRCRQDRRLRALRFPARAPHGFNRDPEPAPDLALPRPGAEAGCADEEPGIGSAHGNRGELQQAAAAPDVRSRM
jgi:hypothetical protein